MSALLLVLVGASGAAALIYEIIWLQCLQIIIGSTAVSLAVLLAAFMGGMSMGSLLIPRRIAARRHPLRVFALFELAVGLWGLVILWLLPVATSLYAVRGGSGTGGFLFRGLVAAVFLLPPTVAMGASLPILARLASARTGAAQLGFVYAANVAGSVGGCVLAGFYLLRLGDLATGTYAAVAVTVTVAAVARFMAQLWQHPAPASSGPSLSPFSMPRPLRPAANACLIGAIMWASGFSALAAEAVWTRLLGMLLGPTVYTFSIVLAVFLAALSVGSVMGAALSRASVSSRRALASCQLLVPVAVAWAAHAMAALLPYWTAPRSAATSPQIQFLFDALRVAVAVTPAALLWGASFTLSLAAVFNADTDPARTAGLAYASNAFGAVVGALTGSLVLLPLAGTSGAHRTIVAVSLAAGAMAFAPDLTRRGNAVASSRWRRGGALTVAIAGVVLLSVRIPGAPGLAIAYGRESAAYAGAERDLVYVGEGTNASIAVSRLASGVLLYHNAGKVQASSQPIDMRLQRMLGHLTTLITPHPDSVLVIGCGAGATAGAVSIDPAVARVTIVDIEPLVPLAASRYFSGINHGVLLNVKTRVLIDDARHYLSTTAESFDAITSDPLDPWVKGSASLYTREFFELVRAHLNPGGAATVFVQLYRTTPDAVRSELATFFDVFPDGAVWANTAAGRGYDLVLVGRAGRTVVDLDDVRRRLSSPPYAAVRKSLEDVEIPSVLDLVAGYAGRASDLGEWLQDAAINTDRNQRLEYLAGLGSSRYEADRIFAEIERRRRFPTGFFVGSDDLVALLRPTMRPALPR